MKTLFLSFVALTCSLFLSEKGYAIEMFEGCVRGECSCTKAYTSKSIRFNDRLCEGVSGRPNGCYCDYKE